MRTCVAYEIELLFTSECEAFMSKGGVGREKKRLVDSCEIFFYVEPSSSGKANRGLSQTQISVHRASAEVVSKLCLNWK